MTARQLEIYGCFDGLSDIHPAKSDAFLIQLTADTMGCSYDDVVAALEAKSRDTDSSWGGR